MQRTVNDAGACRKIEGAGQLRRDAQCQVSRRRARVAHPEVERVGRHEILRKVGRHAGDAGRDWRGNRGMREIRGNRALDFGHKLMGPFGRQIQTEEFDCHEPILFGLVGSKDGSERPGANLMKDAERTERVRLRCAEGFGLQ